MVFRIILISLMLAGCAVSETRTDKIQTTLVLEIVDYDTMRERCSQWKNARACTVNGRVVMHGWKEGTHLLNLNVQFLSWKDIGAKCGRAFGSPSCYKDNTLYTHEYNVFDLEKMGSTGEILAQLLSLEEGQLNRNDTLGHEFHAHILGQTHQLRIVSPENKKKSSDASMVAMSIK
jgi:hypothetical protein